MPDDLPIYSESPLRTGLQFADLDRLKGPDTARAWQQGRLVFRDVSLLEVSTTLERWYDVDFQINDPTLGRSHVTAFFEKQTLTEVVDVLAETLGARYERTGNTITFYRK